MLGSKNQLEMLQAFLMPLKMYSQLLVVEPKLPVVVIETGVANTGDPVEIIGKGEPEKLTSTITGVEMFRSFGRE
jgi:translation elongation factor EF-Tu-like GTPase